MPIARSLNSSSHRQYFQKVLIKELPIYKMLRATFSKWEKSYAKKRVVMDDIKFHEWTYHLQSWLFDRLIGDSY